MKIHRMHSANLTTGYDHDYVHAFDALCTIPSLSKTQQNLFSHTFLFKQDCNSQFSTAFPVPALSQDMFNLNVTGLFSGAYPSSIAIKPDLHKSAVQFYRVQLRARVTSMSIRSTALLVSTYGFQIRIERSSSSRASKNIRLYLHPFIDREKLASDLGAGAQVKISREGLVVTDPYGVTWILA